jgi:hypothetical protein
MPDDIFMTRAQLSRIAGLDLRNKLVQNFQPDGFLLMGSKKIPLFRNSPLAIARLSAAGRTPGPKMPVPQPERLQPEAIKP